MAEKRLDEMAWRNIGIIRSNRDAEFVRDVLESRSDFLRLRLRHEPAIRNIYIESADNVARAIRQKAGHSPLTTSHLRQLEKNLRMEAERIQQATTSIMRGGMEQAGSYGGRALERYLHRAVNKADIGLDGITLQRGFADVNRAAVEALWARTHKGLLVSDRIWNNSESARDAMRTVLQTGVAMGRDAVSVARDLQQYVRQGRSSLAEDYPNMMARMGTRVPKDISYEALRLVRTEYTRAFTEGVYARGRANPAYEGIQWLLSDAHPVPDVCDDMAEADLYDMGAGVYPKGEEPVNPHPNCLCFPIPVLMDMDKFVEELIEWKRNPESKPYLEEWFQEVYRPMQGGGQVRATLSTMDKIQQKIKGGIRTEADARELGELVQHEVEARSVRSRSGLQDLELKVDQINAQIDQASKERRKLFEQYLDTKQESFLQQYKDGGRQIDELIAEVNRYQQEVHRLRMLEPEIYREVLSEIRPLGNTGAQVWAKGSRVNVREAFSHVENYMPTSWLERSNATELLAKNVSRGYYRPAVRGPAEFALSGRNTNALRRVAFHEVGHRFEDVVPGIRELEREFYARRTAGEPLAWMGQGYRKDELTRRDSFINPYIGKDYGGQFYEIMSMGIEGIFAQSYKMGQDPEFRNFILGVLAGI